MTLASHVRILIVDDHPLIREGIKLGLKSRETFSVCGEAETAEEAINLVRVLSPDLVIVDLSLKDEDGMELVKKLSGMSRAPRILVCSMYDANIYAPLAIQNGATGYINKEHAADSLVDAVESVMRGAIYCSESLSDRVLTRLRKAVNQPPHRP